MRDEKLTSIIEAQDNETLHEELLLYLADESCSVRGPASGEELNQAIEEQGADILILNLNLPEEDDISIAKRIRQSFPSDGIIMLTARVRSADRLESYATGADV